MTAKRREKRMIAKDLPFMFPGEVSAIATVLEAGRRYGYGNMIDHLQREWDDTLAESIKEFRARRQRGQKK